MRTIRILHLIANRWWTGSADPALDLAQSLRARGHDVTFACMIGGVLATRASAAGLLPAAGLSLERTARPWVLAADLRRLRRLVHERGIDIMHAHLSHDHWVAALARQGLPVRLVRTVHHRRAIRAGPARQWLLRRTDALLATSESIARAARELGLDPQRVTVIRGAVDITRFAPDLDGVGVRRELGIGSGPVVGCVARLVPGRGHDVLLRAASQLRRSLPALRVLVVGRGEGRSALEALVRELRLEDIVVFAGYRGDDLPRVLAAMDCFVLLGAGSEESCRAALEAMAVGRPVVAGHVGALPETVVDGETGWLVERDPGNVVNRVGAILADPARAHAMGAAGRRRVEALFTSERRAAAVEQVYAGLLGDA